MHAGMSTSMVHIVAYTVSMTPCDLFLVRFNKRITHKNGSIYHRLELHESLEGLMIVHTRFSILTKYSVFPLHLQKTPRTSVARLMSSSLMVKASSNA